MFMPAALILIVPVGLSNAGDTYLNNKAYQPYTLNKVITTQDMYNTNSLIEKIFIQEKEE
jgi:hypothetical protein